ncbi:FGGY-family carbohydrate kinase [Leptolyngbya sp. BC1307]|uniref:FGGY-family carbohydrate kinase n=1 Tax=Leptolyngbya sp. BC1307 TaxID=2029589 RepID=UPI000EFC5594|nr:FGGY-family carbohydrate kinase [Leptolyngbya sp. BC1307]
MLALGIDFGTSGARSVVLDSGSAVVAHSRHRFASGEATSPVAWQQTLWRLIEAIAPPLRSQIERIAINGTSATVLLCDQNGQPLVAPLLYGDDSARSALPAVKAAAPPESPVLSATSSLTKAMGWYQTLDSAVRSQATHLAHQADWLAALLHGQSPASDYHNALKLGYDVGALAYPDWLLSLPVAPWLPIVRVPGEAIAPILPAVAKQFSLSPTCQVCAGTTDSIAAFLASGACDPGEAVTSLGSTLVLKLLSRQPINNQAFGIYSHRLGDLWLVGGASNTGGAVLQQFFSAEQLTELSAQIDLSQPCPLHYYPLAAPGERFPINDPDYPPQLTPRPPQDREFLYGLLNAMARIEAEGYQKLSSLGGPPLQRVYTAGGGAQNLTWQRLRQRWLSAKTGRTIDVAVIAPHTEAAYGTARLAMNGLSQFTELRSERSKN